jgi:hypothetical protein
MLGFPAAINGWKLGAEPGLWTQTRDHRLFLCEFLSIGESASESV